MPRSWFRHDSQMRYDPAVERLSEEFGPLGDLVWRRLLEARCQADGDIVIGSIYSLRSLLALDPEWELDMEAWLHRASQLKLVRLRKTRAKARQIVVNSWEKYQLVSERPEYERDKKRRQRAKLFPGTGKDSVGTSPPTDVTDIHTERLPVSRDDTGTEREANGVPADPDAVLAMLRDLKTKLRDRAKGGT